MFLDMLPETIDPEWALKLAPVAGAAAGGLLGGALGAIPEARSSGSVPVAAFRAATLGVGGAIIGRSVVGRIFKGVIKPRQMVEQYLTLGRGAPKGFTKFQKRLAARWQGSMQEIKANLESPKNLL